MSMNNETISNNDQQMNINQINIQKQIKNNQDMNNPISYSIERNKNRRGSKSEMISPIINIIEKPKPKNKIIDKTNKKEKYKKCLFISFFSLIALLLALSIFIFVYLYIKNKKTKNEKENIDYKIRVEKAMEAFKPSFKINTKKNVLNQILFKSIKNYVTLSDGNETSYSIFTKSKYDIYILNESLPDKDKNFYNMKYTSIVTINSLCTKLLLNSSENDCELQKYLDLNSKNTNSNNLRRNDEDNKDKIKDVILPICIVEHTDTNLILSLTCPEKLSKNLKNEIILAFKNIKPDTIKGLNDNETLEGIIIEEKDDKKYIKSFSKECINYEENPKNNMKCEMNRNIITDNEGNLLYSKKISIIEDIKDNKNKYTNNFTYILEDISKQNKDDINLENYKLNLNIILDLTKSLMIKENFTSNETFNEIFEDLIKDEDNNITEISFKRNLNEDNTENNGIFEENIFSMTFYNITLSLILKNDIGLKYGNYRAISELKVGDETQVISSNEINSKFDSLIHNYIFISKAGNNLANKLYDQLNEPLYELMDNLNTNINELNNYLPYKKLSNIFVSTLSSKGLKELYFLPYEFIGITEYLYKNINELNNNMPKITETMRKKLSNDISSFLKKSHNLLLNIFNNLTEVTNSLSSKKSKIAEISSYYLNNTDTSYVDIIIKAKEILNNYYINEKGIIEPIINKMLDNFDKNINNGKLNNIRLNLEVLLNKLENGTLSIKLANEDDHKNVINNLGKSDIIFNNMIMNINNKFKECSGIQNNGYFETQKEIENNKKSYEAISNRAMNISYILDNNLLIDKTFDEIMKYFREQFIVLLKYMEKSKQEKFPLKENVLINSIFNLSYINQIDNTLKNEKIKIINSIKNENNNYLKLIQNELTSFKNKNQNSLEYIIQNITILLSDKNILNLNNIYKEMLNKTLNGVNSLIEYNINISKEYISKVINAGSTHRTQAFINNYNNIIKTLTQTKNLIKSDLKSFFMNKYKNIFNQIKNLLLIIKSNKILQKYNQHLSFIENQLETTNIIYQGFANYISDELFNKNYIPLINNFINNLITKLNKYENDIKTLYNTQASLPYSNSVNYDYYKLESYSYRCCQFRLGRCWKYKTCWSTHYVGYNVKSNLNFQPIKFDNYTSDFDKLYGDIYNKLLYNIKSYNTTFTELDFRLESIKNNLYNNNYISDFSKNIQYVIDNLLSNNLLISAYNYYKNEINKNLPSELNEILQKWKYVYNYVYNNLNSNIKNFNSSINDFYVISTFYLNIYSQNISLDYSDSIVNKLKIELNYTINYYYNLISSKINNSFSYILNNIPTNEISFNDILNERKKQINTIYNNYIKKIKESKNNILQKQNQLNIIKTTENDFFKINSVVKNNINNINEQLGAISKKFNIKNTKKYSEDSIVARFYLENAQNGKQINENYESVNKNILIELKNDNFIDIMNNNLEIEQYNSINVILNYLNNSNYRILNDFKYEIENYKKILTNKIYKEFFTKEDLIKQINLIYSNGINNLDNNSKNVIYSYVNEVLNKINSLIAKEITRLTDTLTSFNSNYSLIQNRINNYKKIIYNKFYSAITSNVNEFYSQIYKKFYTDYIEKYLDIYKKYENNEKFPQYQFLNISINLKEIMDKNIEIIINEYKTLAKNQIINLRYEYIQKLNNLLSFSNLNNTINKELNNIFNSKLLPTLKEKATYNNEGSSSYDFSQSIIVNIDSFINEKINQTKQIILKMKGKNYYYENPNLFPDFSTVKKKEFSLIKNSFVNFAKLYKNIELNELNEIIKDNVINNFEEIINNFLYNFGEDFFDRILKYNEIQKIKSLYNNIKYSLSQTIKYYIYLSKIKLENDSPIQLPEDIKNKILSLNNLDSIIKSKNRQILSSLNIKFEEFIEDTKLYLINNYIQGIMNNMEQLGFIYDNTKKIINENRLKLETEYINIFSKIIKNPFIEEYTKIINKETTDMNSFIENIKKEAKVDLDKIFTLKIDAVLSDIENKLKKTIKSVEEYDSHLITFNISNDIQKFLYNYGDDIIYPEYGEIIIILDEWGKKIVSDFINNNSEIYLKEYSIEKFEKKENIINDNINNYFNKINEYLRDYGTIYEVYDSNFEEEIYKLEARKLENVNKVMDIHDKQDLNVVKIFKELEELSMGLTQNFNLFSDFDDKINKYINNLNNQYKIAKNMVMRDNYSDKLIIKINELYNISLNYYNQANITYYKMKKSIINSIDKINELIKKCENITYQTINDKYVEIKNNFKPIKALINNQKESINYIWQTNGNNYDNYVIENKINNIDIENEFALDVIFENDGLKEPKIIGKIINKNRPTNYLIDIYSKTGQNCGKIGREIEINLNNISLSTNIIFDDNLKTLEINITTNFDEYVINTQYYEFIEQVQSMVVSGIEFIVPSCCQKQLTREKISKIISSKNKSTITTYNY